ncbi:SNF2 family N-terminal domain-containing protein [Annulohypoxylon maeteangense]|uniref:SNF2 family N-terminal domain-containing protein n=1 Tax=Annulohypoxylon maeteangense TaxID=1927788 RepID=UPI0020089557|nr:SNF2 family N-terminal domain-containing protein [Annulohypoxylon maeteangense]KAI0889137.1 SNF2 family N-terminal domain-containing protein [Annulohypoxylon maeteangense]
MNDNVEDFYPKPPISRIKRSWESTNHWGESSEAAFESPVKKTCVSEPVNFQQSNIPEFASPNEPGFPSLVDTLGFQHTPSIEPTAPSSSIFSGDHMLPPAGDSGYLDYLSPDILYLEQSCINKSLPAQKHVSLQHWTPQGDEGWQSFNSMDNIYFDWPTPSFSSFQDLNTNNEWVNWEETSNLVAEYNDISINDNLVEGSSCIDSSCNGRNSEYNLNNDDVYSLTPFSNSPPTAQDIVGDHLITTDEIHHEVSYDSCFGVMIFEDFKVHDNFYKGKTTIKHVSLEVTGAIRNASSNEYGGLLNRSASRVVSDLNNSYDVELSAYMTSRNKIEVLIYGRFEQGESIGDMLLERDCFLQQPKSYDTSRPYYNPQCLSNPNEGDSFWKDNGPSPAQSTVLPEKEKSRVVELFDSATGPVNFRRIQISEILISKLKEHQIKALSMMTEKESGNICQAEFPSVWSTSLGAKGFNNHVTKNYTTRKPRLCLGGLLADEMGLGKTLTALALIATSLSNDNVTLIVCPMTTITSWQDQIERHFRKGSLTYKIYHGSARNYDLAALKSVNIVITTYETLRADFIEEGGVRRRSNKATKVDQLHSISWHRVILDEAHVVRNRATKKFQAVNMLRARHRWCLTGTPIQNRLEDLGALVEFLKVGPFDNPSVFESTFITPIDQGGQSGWERLRCLVRSITLRRTKKALDSDLNLPPRFETVHLVKLDEREISLYNLMKRHFALAIDSGGSAMQTFQLILRLRQICNHGSDLLPPSLRAWLNEASAFDTDFPRLHSCEKCDATIIDEDEVSPCVLSCFHQVCRACIPNDDTPTNGGSPICPLCDDGTLGENKKTNVRWRTISQFEKTIYRPSSKVKALLHNLQSDRQATTKSNQPSAKSVVFSTWTSMLDLISEALSTNNFEYQRLDGSMNLSRRSLALKDFRENPNCTVLLASLGSAAVGLDLTMATRVHLMEPGWNPLLEQQAIDRIHRLGQEREVIATRYVVSGSDSIEQYVLKRQEHKINIIKLSLEEPKTNRDKVEDILRDLRRTMFT